MTVPAKVPAGYVRLDDALARELTPGTVCYTPHTSAGRDPGSPLGWGLAAVLIEGVRELGEDSSGRSVTVIDANMPQSARRVTLAYDEKGKPASDAARYKACGNGVVSHCSEWIAARLVTAHTEMLAWERAA